MADRYRDERDTNYFRESYGSQDSNRSRDDRGQYGQQGTRYQGYGQDAETRRGYTGYEGRDYNDRYSDRGDRTVEGSGAQGRNFAERAGDEVKSWVGDSDAERRREQDRQTIGRYPGEGPGSDRMNVVDRTRGYGDRSYGGSSNDRTVEGSGAGGRNWAERTGDEVKSWVGDSDAERRREQDRQTIGRYPGEGPGEREFGAGRGYGDSSRYSGGSMAGYGSQSYGGGDYGSSRYSQGQGYGGRTTPAVTYSDDDRQGGQGYGARSSSYTPSSYSAYDDRGTSNRAPMTDYNSDERGFLAKAGDELKSWFGDEEAERRRQADTARADAEGAFSGDSNRGDAGYGYTGSTSASSQSKTLHDPHYAEYRKARMAEYDRDYDEYRKSKAQDFHQDFHNWRSTKSTGTASAATGASAVGAAAGAAASMLTGSASQVKEHQVVIGSDGQGLGKVDHVLGSDIKLTKHDSSDGKHHLIPLSWVASVEGDKVKLSKTSDEAMREWRTAEGDQNKTSTTTTQA